MMMGNHDDGEFLVGQNTRPPEASTDRTSQEGIQTSLRKGCFFSLLELILGGKNAVSDTPHLYTYSCIHAYSDMPAYFACDVCANTELITQCQSD